MAPQRNKKKVRLAIVLVLASPLLALGLVISWYPDSHWCWQVSGAQILYNGKPSLDSRLYAVGDGQLILRATAPESREYIIAPNEKKVYYPNGGNYRYFPLGALRLKTEAGIDLDYTPKSDVDPKIVAGQHFIEFTSLRKQRVRVSW